MNDLLSNWTEKQRYALAGAGGLLLAAAFPKLDVAGLAWVAPGMILFAALGAKSPFRAGYVAGLAFHLAALHWLLFIPVSFYPILGWLALCGFLALYPAVWAWLCAGSVVRGPWSVVSETWLARQAWALFCAAAWVALEMVQARLFTGFPWNLLGTSQQRLWPLIQVASFTGVYGVSFVVVWFSAALLLTLQALAHDPARRHLWLRHVALPMLAVAGLYAVGWRQIRHRPPPARTLRVALVQPSIPQTLIWDTRADLARFEEVLKLSSLALETKPDLLIWPEAAVPSHPRWDTNLWRAITNHVVAGGAWLIMGADDVVPRGPDAEDDFNSSFLISPRGEMVATYRKRRLVIFGEYVPLVRWLPFAKWLTPITGGFTPGDGVVPFEMPDLGARTATLICFEDVFPQLVRESAAPDTDFLVNITNDGWFRESAAHWQHAATAAFRAVENRLPLVRCANNGLTCWIDETGVMREVQFGDSPDIYRAGIKTAEIPLLSGAKRAPTFYTRHGDVFGWGCVIVGAGGWAALLSGRRGRSGSQADQRSAE
ncbi:MAG: apolipoprotein N-acyltransferase [Verrucomicrobia bacterium]|nr:apolipoprotein N-acyltransferase [Verrucomicrobiota bacterium]